MPEAVALSTVTRGDRLIAARGFLDARRFDEAEALLDELLGEDPHSVEALNAFGGLWLARNDAVRAHAVLAAAATAFPDHEGVINNLGIAHQMSGRLDEAIICFERACALAPHRDAPLQSLAMAHFLKGDLAKAAEVAESILARTPDSADARGLMGLIALAAGNHDAAEAHLRQALGLRPDDAASLRALSVCCARRGDDAQALMLAERARLAAPLDVDTLEQLARCQAQAGRLPEAQATCRKVLAFSPNHLGMRALLARILVASGQAEPGIAELTKVARANPNSAEALIALAVTVRQSGRLEHVAPLLDQALRLEPGNAAAISQKAELALALGAFPARIADDDPQGARILVPLDLPAAEFILLSRFLLGLAGEERRVKLSADARFLPLAAHLPIAIDLAEPDPEEPVLLLPALMQYFDLDPDWLGGIKPYLAPDEALRQRWRGALEEHPRPWIGVLWDGGAPGLTMEQVRRAVPEGGTCISLMTGAGRHALASWPEAVDAGHHFAGFHDMIAAIANCDVVVGPDVAGVHLAGALGRPGFVAVAAGLPWYWASRDGRSLWYPAIEVARQARVGSWDDVTARLTSALSAMPDADLSSLRAQRSNPGDVER